MTLYKRINHNFALATADDIRAAATGLGEEATVMNETKAARERAWLKWSTEPHGTGTESKDIFEDGFDAGFAAAESSDQWVRINGPDDLPKEDGYYLGTVGSFGIDPSETTCHELNWFKGKWYLPNDEMVEMGPVIAWREKPQPCQPAEEVKGE